MESEGKIKLGYWKIRGLFRHIQYVLEYCGVEYDTKYYEAGSAPDYSGKDWFDEKFNLGLDFPNLPYLVDGDFKMTETVPIMFYIAEKYKPELIGETAKDKGTIKMLMNIIHGAKMNISKPCYSQDDKSVVMEAAEKSFEPISKFLGDKDFFMGDTMTSDDSSQKPTLPDLYITELITLVLAFDTEKKFAEKFPNIVSLQKRVHALPEIKAFFESDRCPDLPFFYPLAKLHP
ncbi:unnamed protein product [Moneuplotes crassus]|uniref:glutathione transferase n=1 Tax=Euplotes crassus TaxID=5936 RepID=A0AAD1XUT2_EUPCR|nr:unnamed protein product [Moneuplotes crassus]